MTAREGVILTLSRTRERMESTQLSVGVEYLTSAREYLVAVSLMAHIPHYTVVRGVIHIVQCHRQFCHTKA